MDTDQQMRGVLLELMMLMHGKCASLNPSTSGSRERDPRPSGDSYPVAEEYRDRYERAANELDRQRVLHDARDELARWRGHGAKRHAGESEEELVKRMLDDGKGFDPQTVAVRFATSAGRVRKIRAESNYHPETGAPLPGAKDIKTTDPARIIELRQQGCTLNQILRITKAPKTTVARILRKAA